jgi:hypothetical protein
MYTKIKGDKIWSFRVRVCIYDIYSMHTIAVLRYEVVEYLRRLDHISFAFIFSKSDLINLGIFGITHFMQHTTSNTNVKNIATPIATITAFANWVSGSTDKEL